MAHFLHSSCQDKQESASCAYLRSDPLTLLTGLVQGEMCTTAYIYSCQVCCRKSFNQRRNE